MDPTASHRHSRPFQLMTAILRVGLLGSVAMIVLIVGCQSNLIYFPRPYPAGTTSQWQHEFAGRTIDATTSQGHQRAFLQGNLHQPRHLWIVCGGNATLALDWANWLQTYAQPDDAWLLVDFPGYGDCNGSPNPDRIRETFRALVPAASHVLGWPNQPDPNKLRFFGHSLGAAACLIAASEFGIQRGVLLAPFTSTMEMAHHMTGLPIGFLVIHRFNNHTRLDELDSRGPGQVIILHGSDDEIIPVTMGLTLAKEHPNSVKFIEIPHGNHNNIQQLHPEIIANALKTAAD